MGAREYRHGEADTEDKIGQVTGLVWTAAGGDLLSVEACKFAGRGKILRTGKLGQVLQESVDAAFSAVRAQCDRYQLRPEVWRENDFHVHLPEGAIPKDGPSAGVAIAVALLSAVSAIPARADGGDDRRDYFARRGAAGGRGEGKIAGGGARRREAGDFARGKREGFDGFVAGGEKQI